jgi:hypothetical protein
MCKKEKNQVMHSLQYISMDSNRLRSNQLLLLPLLLYNHLSSNINRLKVQVDQINL